MSRAAWLRRTGALGRAANAASRRPWVIALGSLCVSVALSPRLAPAEREHHRAASPLSVLETLQLTAPVTARVFFAASTFAMGSALEEMELAHAECTREVHGALCEARHFQNEGPARRVQLSAFQLDRHEVSVAEYERCVDAQRCSPVPYFKGARRFAAPNYPVSLITWDEAADYCRFVGAHLPSEAQWERAARGLTARRYPWGNLYHPGRSNHGRLQWDETDGSDGQVELAEVGSYPSGATPDGVFDLAGNVEEWAADHYDDEYNPRDLLDPLGPQAPGDDGWRSVRGGSYTSPSVRLRGASRTGQRPSARDPARGLRCALSAQPTIQSQSAH